MLMEGSFQQFSVQYEFDFWNENVLHVKGGYLKKPRLTNSAKMRNANLISGTKYA